MALLIGAALLVAQLVNFALILNERQKLSLAQNQGPAITRFAAVAGDLKQAPAEFRSALLDDASRRGAAFTLDRESAVTAGMERDERVEARLRQALEGNGVEAAEVRAGVRAEPHPHHAPRGDVLLLSARLGANAWLNGRLTTPRADPWLHHRLAAATLLLYLIVLGATLFLARRLASPLRDLTRAAESFGGREAPPAVAVRGPSDLRRAIDAFNRMNRRVVALLDEKDRMLGAIGHDLRTPLASLRIRAELVEPEEERARIVATIDEMSAMIEDILVLARSGRAREGSRPVDLAALVEALVEDHRALGADVSAEPAERLVLAAQPNLLRRAVRNLIDNAVKYAGGASVGVRREGEEVLIEVADRGPGLAPDDIERAAEPFYRVEGSRSRETGGAGLGLAIARAVAESHGGSLRLANREGGGLVAALVLPA
jgi:signal transduction histidine kinase